MRKINLLDSIKQCKPGEENRPRPIHNFGENLRPIVGMVEGGILPSLEVISCVLADGMVNCAEQERYQLAKSNVCVLITESNRETESG